MDKNKTTVKYQVRLIGKKPKGSVIPEFISEVEAEKIKKTGKYKFQYWPDSDSFHCEIEKKAVAVKITTIEEILK